MNDEDPERTEPLEERNGSALTEIQQHVKNLLSEDYLVRVESVHSLEKYGEKAAGAIVDALLKKASQPHVIANLSEALEEIGKPAENAIVQALSQVSDLKRPEDVYLLEGLVNALVRIQERRAAPALALQVEKLNRAIHRNGNKALVDVSEAAKVRLHEALAEMNERGGLEDLLDMLGDGRKRVRDGVVEALGKIGDERALVPLLRLHEIEQDVSFSGASEIKTAFREIVRREKVEPTGAVFKDLTEPERTMLEKFHPRSKPNGNGHH